jgi:hypothetical protein
MQIHRWGPDANSILCWGAHLGWKRPTTHPAFTSSSRPAPPDVRLFTSRHGGKSWTWRRSITSPVTPVFWVLTTSAEIWPMLDNLVGLLDQLQGVPKVTPLASGLPPALDALTVRLASRSIRGRRLTAVVAIVPQVSFWLVPPSQHPH